MDYSTGSSEGQQNVTIGAESEPQLALTLDCMHFLSDQYDFILAEASRSDYAALEMAVDAVISMRRLARHLGVELQSPFGRGWVASSRSQIARSLVAEVM